MPIAEFEKQQEHRDIRHVSERVYNAELEHSRARQIVGVCTNYSFRSLKKLDCVDLGLSTDSHREYYGKYFRQVISLDKNSTDANAVSAVRSGNMVNLYSSLSELSLPDNSVDVIICNRIYGRLSEPKQLMSEIYRILKYSGFCYFGAENKYHFSVGRNNPKENRLLSLGNLKKLTSNFWRHDYTSLIIHHPESFSAEYEYAPGSLKSRLPGKLFSGIYPFLPEWVWVLTKKK